MSIFTEEKISWHEQLMLQILDAGDIPEHIAIIMDGNRRYAKKHHLENVGLGHKDGAKTLRKIIQWLSYLHNVKMLSVYAFSILNFRRSPEEVKYLMDLAEGTFQEMADKPEFFTKHRCKVEFIGRIELLEERVKKQMRRVLEANDKNPLFTLNICVCYTSHDEIERSKCQCIEKHIPLNEENIFENLELNSKPDLLVRTSGVMRMSNFMLMQCAKCPIIVSNVLWPEISFKDLIDIILRYQLRNFVP